MKDEDKTKAELMEELAQMRRKVANLETDYQHAKKQLHLFKEIVQQAQEAIIVTTHKLESSDSEVIFANPAFTEITGYSVEELQEKNFCVLQGPDPLDQVSLCTQLSLQRPIQGQTLNSRKDGTPFILQWYIIPIRDEDHQITYVAAIQQDVTEQKEAEKSLRLSQERYQLAANAGKVGVWDWNLETDEIYLSPNLKAMLGYQPDEIANHMEEWIKHVHPNDVEAMTTAVSAYLEGTKPQYELEHRMLHKDGTTHWILTRGVAFRDETGKPYRMTGTDTDITELKQVEQTLAYRTHLEQLVMIISTWFINLPISEIDNEINQTLNLIGQFLGIDGCYVSMWSDESDQWSVRYVWQAEGIIFKKMKMINQFPADFCWSTKHLKRLEHIHIPNVEDFPSQAQAEKEAYRTMGIHSTLIVPMSLNKILVGVIEFITLRQNMIWPRDRIALLNLVGEMFVNALERKRAEEQIQSSLAEKEILLKEIHHRVKNNLQIISSLLYLQSNYIKDEQTQEIIQDSQSRIESMALIHKKLYETRDISRIDFASYINNLVSYLLRSYSNTTIEVTIEVDDIFLGIDTAIPCGLIITELVSNSFKHAFPPEQKKNGKIVIMLKEYSDHQFVLTVKDNGIGLPDKIDIQLPKTLGLQLVARLIYQLNGTLEQENGASHGTEFRIKFRKPKEKEFKLK